MKQHSNSIDSINELNKDFLEQNEKLENLIGGFFDVKKFKKSIEKVYGNCKNIENFYGENLDESSLEKMFNINSNFIEYENSIEEFNKNGNPVVIDLINKYYVLNPDIGKKVEYIKNLEKDFEKGIISNYVLLEQKLINIEETIDEKKIDLVSDKEEINGIKEYFNKFVNYNNKINSLRKNVFNEQPINKLIDTCKEEISKIETINKNYVAIKSILEKNKNFGYNKNDKDCEFILNRLPMFKNYLGNKNVLGIFYSLKEKRFPVDEVFEYNFFERKHIGKIGSFFRRVDKTNVWVSHLLSVFVGMSIMGTIIGFGQCDYNELIRQKYLNRIKNTFEKKVVAPKIEKSKVDSINKKSKDLENSIETFYYGEENVIDR